MPVTEGADDGGRAVGQVWPIWKRAHYALIQYCPDLSRLETVNVGVVLLVPEDRFLGVRVLKNTQRAIRFFGRDRVNADALSASLRSLAERLRHEHEQDTFRTVDDLDAVSSTRGNALLLTRSRPMVTSDPEGDLDRLFDELVAAPS